MKKTPGRWPPAGAEAWGTGGDAPSPAAVLRRTRGVHRQRLRVERSQVLRDRELEGVQRHAAEGRELDGDELDEVLVHARARRERAHEAVHGGLGALHRTRGEER